MVNVPLLGQQAANTEAAIQALYNTLYINAFGHVVADNLLGGISEQQDPAAVAAKTRIYAMAALNDLLTVRPKINHGPAPSPIDPANN